MSFEQAEFFAKGTPMAKQSFHVSGHGGGYRSQSITDWQETIGLVVRDWCIENDHRPDPKSHYTVELVFALPGNKDADIDNLSKAVLDSINGRIWEDDRQVLSLVVSKVHLKNDKSYWAGVFIRIRQITYYTPALLSTLVPVWPRRKA